MYRRVSGEAQKKAVPGRTAFFSNPLNLVLPAFFNRDDSNNNGNAYDRDGFRKDLVQTALMKHVTW
jgi:hypothetical protein